MEAKKRSAKGKPFRSTHFFANSVMQDEQPTRRTLNRVQHSIARCEPSAREGETPGNGSEGRVCYRKTISFYTLSGKQRDA